MRYLIVRIGDAWGDVVIVTPLFRYLKKHGHEVYFLTGDAGKLVVENNPYIDKILYHKRDSVLNTKLGEHFKQVMEENKCDKLVDLCESVEVEIILYVVDPKYNYPKQERRRIAEKNMYEFVFTRAELPIPENSKDLRPDIFLSDEIEQKNVQFRAGFIGKKIILWGLSGSALHKSYPYTAHVMRNILEQHEDVVFVTVGDEDCQILECVLQHPRVINKAGKWSMSETMAMAKHAFMVIAPETGLLHVAGAFKTPKMGFLSHTTREALSKHFEADYSLEAKVDCAPCFRFILKVKVQCPVDKVTGGAWCSAYGFDQVRVTSQINAVINKNQSFSDLLGKTMPKGLHL